MWRNDGIISSRKELARPNATQTHSQCARRLNKEKHALTLWSNGESSDCVSCIDCGSPNTRPFLRCAASLRIRSRHSSSCRPQIPRLRRRKLFLQSILYPPPTTPQSSWRPGIPCRAKKRLAPSQRSACLQYAPLASNRSSISNAV